MNSKDTKFIGMNHPPIHLRPHSTPATLVWLEENYEMADGICIPRNTVYQHYVDFCARQALVPVNAASFGKIIRQQFPGLTTRRLGTRGQSRYHYYGIAIRDRSLYYEIQYSKRGSMNLTESKKDQNRQNGLAPRQPYSQLSDFPNIKDLHLPQSVSKSKVSTFLMMYRSHCHRVAESISSFNVEETQSLTFHFWREIPLHLMPILRMKCVINILGICDCSLYKNICNIWIPSILQPISDKVISFIQTLSSELTKWLEDCLQHVPSDLKQLKLMIAHKFAKMIQRKASLNHLCQTTSMVLHSPEMTSQMAQDWRQMDLDNISHQTLFSADRKLGSLASLQLFSSLTNEFERLLRANSPMEQYTSWLEGIVDRCVTGAAKRNKIALHKVAHSFLKTWSAFTSHLIKEMTHQSLPSFGSFHLVHLTFDDFVLCTVESLHFNDKIKELYKNVSMDVLPNLTESYLEKNFTEGIRLLSNPCSSGNSNIRYAPSSVQAVSQIHSITSSAISNPSHSQLQIDSQNERNSIYYVSDSASCESNESSVSTTNSISVVSSHNEPTYSASAINYYPYYEYDTRNFKSQSHGMTNTFEAIVECSTSSLMGAKEIHIIPQEMSPYNDARFSETPYPEQSCYVDSYSYSYPQACDGSNYELETRSKECK